MKTLKEVCSMTGISRRSIQEYERYGLVKPSGKNKYGYNLYDNRTIRTIEMIRFYSRMGFKLREIGSLMRMGKKQLREELEKKIACREEDIRRTRRLVDEAYDLMRRL